jgi:hypothetical protein
MPPAVLFVFDGFADWEPCGRRTPPPWKYRVEVVGLAGNRWNQGLRVVPVRSLRDVDPADVAVFITGR